MHDALWVTQPMPAVTAERPRPPAGHRVAAVGIVLIGYSYLAALWPVRHGYTPEVVLAVREWLNLPLGIGADFGLLGVGLLLLAGGYWAAEVLVTGGRLAWLTLVRGYLPYGLACSISWLLLLGGASPLTVPERLDPAAGTYPLNLVLVDRLTGEGALLGLGWAVAVAACFALLLAATGALIRRGSWAAMGGVAVQLAAVAALSVTAALTGGWFQQFGVLATFCVFPVLGELLWLARGAKAEFGALGAPKATLGATTWTAAPLGLTCLVVMIAADRNYPQLSGAWHPLTLIYVVLVALLALKAGPPGKAAQWLGDRAYPAALLVCAIGYPLLTALARVDVPFWASLPLAVAVTLGIADIVHRLTAVLTR